MLSEKCDLHQHSHQHSRELITKRRRLSGCITEVLGANLDRTAVNGDAGSCIQGSAIGNATSASSSACSWRIPGMFSFRSTRDDRETQFLLHSRPQWSTCGLGIALRCSCCACVQTSTAPCTERPRISHQNLSSTPDSGSRRIPPGSGHMQRIRCDKQVRFFAIRRTRLVQCTVLATPMTRPTGALRTRTHLHRPRSAVVAAAHHHASHARCAG